MTDFKAKTMVSVIQNKQVELEALCRRFHVRRLDIFGSAAAEQLGDQSDIDFLVEFDDTVRENRFDTFFGLLNALRELFSRPIDLVEPGGLRNPYFINDVNQTRRPIYVAS
jgi:hypothetical protein